MNSLNSVRTVIIDYLEEASSHVSESLLLVVDETKFLLKVYDAFFNLIADPTRTPESIIHILNTYTSGLDGFSTSTCLQTVIAFACFEALARRRPEVINGQWELLLWIIVKYSSFPNSEIGNGLTLFKKTNIDTLKFITELGSPEVCPNPCLRLELFRLIRCFNCRGLYYDRESYYYDRESYRDQIINTLFEICDNYTSLTINQFPNFSPIDLQLVMNDNSINMGCIMNDCNLEIKKSEMIFAVLKLTSNFALLEKEKHQRLNSQAIVREFWHVGPLQQLSACLSLCGLLSQDRDDNYDQDACILYLVQAVGNDYLLQNYVIDTLDTITKVSLCFPDDNSLKLILLNEKNNILHKFLKGHVKQFPIFQYMQEINGGIAPAVEYRLRYFQNISRQNWYYHDSDYDSESYDSD